MDGDYVRHLDIMSHLDRELGRDEHVRDSICHAAVPNEADGALLTLCVLVFRERPPYVTRLAQTSFSLYLRRQLVHVCVFFPCRASVSLPLSLSLSLSVSHCLFVALSLHRAAMVPVSVSVSPCSFPALASVVRTSVFLCLGDCH